MLTIDREHPRAPIGGYNFPNHGTALRGANADEVISLMTRFRAVNALPLGDPEGDLARHLQNVAPWLVSDDGKGEPATSERTKVAEWIMAAWKERPQRIEPFSDEAVNRRAVCEVCPYYVKSVGDEKGQYWDAAISRGSLLAGVIDYGRAGYCSVHRWANFIASRLVNPWALAQSSVPSMCWLHSVEVATEAKK